MLQLCRFVIASSTPYLETSATLAPWSHKAHVIPLATPDRRGSSTGAPRDWARRPLQLLSVGRLSYYKGFVHLVEAMSHLEDCELTLIGAGDQRSALETRIRTLGLHDRVRLVGDCDDEELARLYQSTHLFCLPSIERTEAFGIVLLEAMRAGTPCLVTDVEGSGMSWVVRSGETGLVVRHSDPQALAESIQWFESRRDKLQEMGEKARERFQQSFSLEACSEAVSELYSEL